MVQVQDGVAHDLSRPVERDVAAAVDAEKADAFLFQGFGGDEQVGGVAMATQGIYRRVLGEQQEVLCGEGMLGGAVGGLAGSGAVEQPGLEFPGLAIIRRAEVFEIYGLVGVVHSCAVG